jgi:hypothetical protein
MRNFKKVIALVLSIALMMSTFTVAFAAEPTNASKLVTLGLLSDDSASALSAELTRKIGITTILKALGYTQADANAAVASKFTDTKDWTGVWANLAAAKGITLGTTTTTFGGNLPLSGAQFITFALRANGIAVLKTTDALSLAIAAGILPAGATIPAKFTKADAPNVIFASLSVVNPTTKLSLIDTLIAAKVVTEAQAVAVGLKAANLQISSITAPNARQVVITFNKEVNADTLTTDNVKVYLGSNTAVTTYTKAVVGNTVTLGLTTAAGQDTDVKVVINKVEAKAVATDKIAAEVTTTVRMKDITAPSVLSVVASTSKTFKITTSEPLAFIVGELSYHVLANITIDGVKLVAMITPDYAANTANVTLGTKLAVGDHPIVIDGYKDAVGFAAPKFTGTLSIVADTAVPAIVSVDTVNKNSVKLNFNEPVAVLGTVTIDGNATGVATASADSKTWTVAYATGLGLASLIKSTVSYIGTTDMEGNTISGTAKTFDFVAADDLVAPTATITFKSDNKIQVKFSETVTTAGYTLTVKDSKGVATAAFGALTLDTDDTSSKTYYTLTTPLSGSATYTVELKDVKDNSVRTNAIATTSATVTSFDVTPPTISDVIVKTLYSASPDTKGQATVYFSEAIDVASITNLTNYLVDLNGTTAGAAVQLSTISGAAATAAADGKSVVLTIPGATFAAGAAVGPGVTEIYVLAVKDAAGTLIAIADFNAAKFVKATASVTGPTASGFKLVAANKIEVTFANALSTVDPSEFRIYNFAGTTLAFVGVSYELSVGNTVATVTLNGSLPTDANIVAAEGLAKLSVLGGNTKDIFGTAVNQAQIAIVDKTAPAVATIATGTALNTIDITFSEIVNAVADATVTADVVVKDADGNVVTPTYTYVGGTPLVTNFKTVTLTLPALSTGKTFTVEVIARSIKDLGNNVVAAKAATSVVAK